MTALVTQTYDLYRALQSRTMIAGQLSAPPDVVPTHVMYNPHPRPDLNPIPKLSAPRPVSPQPGLHFGPHNRG
jgi:hypothetical protein